MKLDDSAWDHLVNYSGNHGLLHLLYSYDVLWCGQLSCISLYLNLNPKHICTCMVCSDVVNSPWAGDQEALAGGRSLPALIHCQSTHIRTVFKIHQHKYTQKYNTRTHTQYVYSQRSLPGFTNCYQLIYTLLNKTDNTNTGTEKYSHTKYKYTCSDMQNSLFHCQARFKLDPKVQREAQELHFSRPYPYTPCSRILWYAECAILIVHDTAIENTEW